VGKAPAFVAAGAGELFCARNGEATMKRRATIPTGHKPRIAESKSPRTPSDVVGNQLLITDNIPMRTLSTQAGKERISPQISQQKA
jgi:hypothetical protein